MTAISTYQKIIISIFLLFNIFISVFYYNRLQLPYNEAGNYFDTESGRVVHDITDALMVLCIVAWTLFLLFLLQIWWKSKKRT